MTWTLKNKKDMTWTLENKKKNVEEIENTVGNKKERKTLSLQHMEELTYQHQSRIFPQVERRLWKR